MGFRQDVRKGITLVSETLSNRRVLAEVREAMAARGSNEQGRYEIGLYFADSKVNLYQLRQWYAPLEQLNRTHPVLLILRSASAAHAVLAETSLAVAYTHSVNQLETVVAQQPLKVMLYVNQNAKNFQMMRYGQRWHVFINHGESDKMYMTTNQFKAYDYALIAGQAARERLNLALWEYDLDTRTISIGRPQVDFLDHDSPLVKDKRPVLLYAPTWEGDRPAAAYGSIATHGKALIEATLGSYQIVYRPHPRSGVLDHGYAAAHRAIVQMLQQANAKGGNHIIDSSPTLGWQLSQADVAVLDVSAMIYDRLATGKPLLVTRPVNPHAEIDAGGFLSVAEWLEAGDSASMLQAVERVRTDKTSRAGLEHWREHYFGDGSPGSSQQRFEAAIDTLLARWETARAAHAESRINFEHEDGEQD